jgi:hypothetical protein
VVEADCSENFAATSGSFMTDTAIDVVRIPQRVYVTGMAPAYPSGMDLTNSAPIGEMVTVINKNAHPVEVTAYATCTSTKTP